MSIDRVRDEMAKNARNGMIQQVGQYVTDRVMHGAALPEGKTLSGAVDEMRAYAKSHAQAGAYCMTDEEAYRIVDKYYGWTAQKDTGKVVPFPVEAAKPAEPDPLDLDALLEGL